MSGKIERCDRVFHPNASTFASESWCEHFGCDFCCLWTLHVNDCAKVLEELPGRAYSAVFHDTLQRNAWKMLFRRACDIRQECFPSFTLISVASGTKHQSKTRCFVSATFLDKNGAIYSPDGRNGVNLVEMTDRDGKSDVTASHFEIPFKIDEHMDSIRYYDSLRILLRMWTVPNEKGFKSSGAPSLAKNLGLLLDDPTFADVALDVGSSRILAHRAVLAARSSVFREYLIAASKDSPQGMETLNLSDYLSNVVHGMLKYMYTDQFPNLPEFEEKLGIIAIAEAYNLERLRNVYANIILSEVNAENVFDALECSIRCNCKVLRKNVICYLKEARVSLVGNPKLDQLATTHLQEVLEVLAEVTAT